MTLSGNSLHRYQLAVATLILSSCTTLAHEELNKVRGRAKHSVNVTMPTLTRDRLAVKKNDQTWHDAEINVASPKDASTIAAARVTYTPDTSKEDEWRPPQETWQRKEGDCEDFALMVQDLCKNNGIEAEVLIVRSNSARKAHAITAGTVNGSIWVSSNGIYTIYQSMNDAKQALARDLGWSHTDITITKREKM